MLTNSDYFVRAREKGPLLFSACFFPPVVCGSSVLVRNLWCEWPAEDLVVLAHRNPGYRTDPDLQVPNVRVQYAEKWPFRNGRLAVHLDPIAAIPVARTLLRIADEVRPRAIWANWPSTPFLLGAWWAAKKLKLPLYVHLHDLWREAYNGKRLYVEKVAASSFEKRLLSDATRLFTITEEARQHYRKKLGVDSFVLHHSVPTTDLSQSDSSLRACVRKGVLHFTGSIYRLMNEDAVLNIVKAIPLSHSVREFECYTPNPPESLAARGIAGKHIRVKFGSKAKVMEAQRSSSIIILALAFNSTNPLEIQTVFPTKLLEYYVSGRPIIVHAPANSWASRHAREYGWAVVVDAPDPALLAKAIDALMSDNNKQESLVMAGRKEAVRRAAPLVAQNLMYELSRLELPS